MAKWEVWLFRESYGSVWTSEVLLHQVEGGAGGGGARFALVAQAHFQLLPHICFRTLLPHICSRTFAPA
jgi:hypothetical protein